MITPPHRGFHFSFFPLIFVALMLPAFSHAAEQTGFVKSGNTPIASAKVTLYQAGTTRQGGATALGSTTAEGNGFFQISFTPPSTDNVILYLIADGPRIEGNHGKGSSRRNPVRLATVLGGPPFPFKVVINELTTVASAYSLAQFFFRSNLKGTSPGLSNAAMMVRNFVDLDIGEISAVLHDSANRDTSTLKTFNSLANMVAACVNELDVCPTFLDLATTPRGQTPRNTLEALVNIVHNPWQNVLKLFGLSFISSVYEPALEPSSPPDAWTLALRFIGVPNTMSGPGNIAFDAAGNAWVTNNFDFINVSKPSDLTKVCGSNLLLTFKPNGEPLFDPPLQGGGLSGTGFGITLDLEGNIWAGNFGFKGALCDQEVPDNSLSKFSPEGIPLSPAEGFTNGPISQPQGTVSDQKGNIWIANCGTNTIVKYPGGNAQTPKIFGPFGPGGRDLVAPFDIAFNHRRWAFITGNQSNTVVVLKPDGTPIRQS
ncbi:MAG: hypothetical protein R3351_03685, partial [Nitrospirales bacterium]|nr:hypothetical protein [Nitrospirales bacterium]